MGLELTPDRRYLYAVFIQNHQEALKFKVN